MFVEGEENGAKIDDVKEEEVVFVNPQVSARLFSFSTFSAFLFSPLENW